MHSGDSACALPPQTLAADVLADLERHTRALADALEVVRPDQRQYAVKDGQVYVLEANPRASRTVPFVAKATGVPAGHGGRPGHGGPDPGRAARRGPAAADAVGRVPVLDHVSVKEAVLPFDRFPGVDTLLGPEMRSTGEVMGVDVTFGLAFAKSQMAAGTRLPDVGHGVPLAGRPGQAGRPRGGPGLRRRSGFSLAATLGTAGYLRADGVDGGHAGGQGGGGGPRPPTPSSSSPRARCSWWSTRPRGLGPRADGQHIRTAAVAHQVPCLTTLAAARAAAAGIADGRATRSRCAASRSCTRPGADAVSAASPVSAERRRRAGRERRAANPVMTASGTSGHGAELAAYGDLGRPRRGRGQVAVGRARGPATPRPRVHEVGAGHAQQRRPAGTRGSRPGWRDDLPALRGAGAHGWWSASGAARWRTTPTRPRRWRGGGARAGRASWRSRST